MVRSTVAKVPGTMDPSASYQAFWVWLRQQGKDLYNGKHSLVIYGDKGKVIRDFTLEDLLSMEEIKKNGVKSEMGDIFDEPALLALDPVYRLGDQITAH